MAWTKEQEQAIYTSGSNIIVSAGAGSGKTAVLTERVKEKVKSGVHINELLILTFTKAAAGEMKERIRDSLKKNNYTEELKLIDSAYITTYLLNISKNINIVEATLINIEKNKIMDQVFENNYEKENELFLKLINDFCIRDDKTLKNYFISIASKLEMLPNVNEYLDNYIDKFYSDEYIDSKILEYEKLVLDKKELLNKKLYDLSILVDGTYYSKVLDSLDGFLKSNSIDDFLLYPSIKLPTLPRGSEDDVKNMKDEVSDIIKSIKNK